MGIDYDCITQSHNLILTNHKFGFINGVDNVNRVLGI